MNVKFRNISLSIMIFLLIVLLAGCQFGGKPQAQSSPKTKQTQSTASKASTNPTTSTGKTTKTTSQPSTPVNPSIIAISDPNQFLNEFAKDLHKAPKDLTNQDFLNVKDLNVSNNTYNAKPVDLTVIGKFKNLEDLEIVCPYQKSDFFNHLHHLKRLLIMHVNLEARNKAMIPNFYNLPTLTNLILTNDNLQSMYFLRNTTHLKEVNLSSNQIELNSNQVEGLQSLSGNKNLESLNLSDNATIGSINGIQAFTQLKFLDISRLSPSDKIDLKPLASLKNLETLWCYDTEIKDDVTPLDGLTHLTAVNFQNTDISSLSFLKNNPNINTLYLDGTNVSDLSVLKDKKYLKYVDIRRTRVDLVAPLKNLPNLKFLLLDKNMISDWPLLKKQGLKISDVPVETSGGG